MDIDYIRNNPTLDDIYDNLIMKYNEIIPVEVDKDYTLLINLLNDYLKEQKGLDDIKKVLNKIFVNYMDFSFDLNTPYITNFGANIETNIRLSIMLSNYLNMRKIAYKKAFILASSIIEGEIPDYKLYEDFNLIKTLLHDFTLDNFYADITIYLSNDTLDRFYNECYLISVVNNILDKGTVNEELLYNLEIELGSSYKKIINYIKKRYLIRKKCLYYEKNRN